LRKLVLLAVPSEAHLQPAVQRAELGSIRCAVFWEPDDGMGFTAACTEPVCGEARRIFRRLPLWRADGSNHRERGPS
jgi:hypothetical protein